MQNQSNMGQGQPVIILPENYTRTLGRDAQRMNILSAKIVAETVRTTLGPRGMDKMLVDSMGDITITNDGVTILEEMEIQHPAAKMMVEVAKTQEDEVGDGTTTAVVLAGELLKRAETLLEDNIHPTIIAKGYSLAARKSIEILKNISTPVKLSDTATLKKVAVTAMTGKKAEADKEKLSDMLIKALVQVMEDVNGKQIIDTENIKIEKKTGGSTDDSELIKGILIDKEKVHSGMPSSVKNARIALIDSALEIKSLETDAQIRITSPDQFQGFMEQEEAMIKKMAEKIINSGANVVFCQKGIDDLAQHYLAKNKIFAVRRVKKSDMEKLSKATGASIITNLDSLNVTDLGRAGSVSETKMGDEDMVMVKDCNNPKAVTLLIRGGTQHVIDEIERALVDAIGDISALIKNKAVVAGGGAPEIEVRKELLRYAESISGKEQLAVKAFAEAMEIIPRTLAENGGLDPITILTEIKARHDKKEKWAGVNVIKGRVDDMWKNNVIEPIAVKTQAIQGASEAAIMILRIDDVIAAGKSEMGGGGMPPGMPPGGMGGMPGMGEM